MRFGKAAGLALAVLAVWLASAAANWRFSSYFPLGVLPILVATFLISRSTRVSWRVFLSVVIGLVLVFAVAEAAFWRLTLTDSEYPMLERQFYGLAASPFAIIAAVLAQQTDKAAADRQSPGEALLLGGLIAGTGILLVAAVLFLREILSDRNYYTMEAIGFGAAATSGSCLLGLMAGRLWPQPPR